MATSFEKDWKLRASDEKFLMHCLCYRVCPIANIDENFVIDAVISFSKLSRKLFSKYYKPLHIVMKLIEWRQTLVSFETFIRTTGVQYDEATNAVTVNYLHRDPSDPSKKIVGRYGDFIENGLPDYGLLKKLFWDYGLIDVDPGRVQIDIVSGLL